MLPSLLIIPKEFFENSLIYIPFPHSFIYESLKLLDFPINNIITIQENELLFIKKYYTILPIRCIEFNGFLLLNLRKLIVNKLNLDQIKPFKYYFYNRKSLYRNISNFNELFKDIKKNYPNIKWFNNDLPIKIIDQFKLFNKLKLFISIHGAAFSNILFMQPNTTIIEIQVERWVDNFLWISSFSNIHHIIGRNISIKWREESLNYIQKDYLFNLINEALLKN